MEEPYYDDRSQMGMGTMHAAMGHPASMGSMIMPRARRHSQVSFAARPPALDPYRVPSAIHIKFKRKASFTSGIGLDEAQQRIRLSNNDTYSFHDLHADSRRRIYLRIKVILSLPSRETKLTLFFGDSGQAIRLSLMKYPWTVTITVSTSKHLPDGFREPAFTTSRYVCLTECASDSSRLTCVFLLPGKRHPSTLGPCYSTSSGGSLIRSVAAHALHALNVWLGTLDFLCLSLMKKDSS